MQLKHIRRKLNLLWFLGGWFFGLGCSFLFFFPQKLGFADFCKCSVCVNGDIGGELDCPTLAMEWLLIF